jgi:hypothetical protein
MTATRTIASRENIIMSSTSPFAPRGTAQEIEEGTSFSPKFDASGLITAVTTDAKTGELLMVAWMNAEALARTVETGEAWYWSRSRGELWHKGETSGQIQTRSGSKSTSRATAAAAMPATAPASTAAYRKASPRSSNTPARRNCRIATAERRSNSVTFRPHIEKAPSGIAGGAVAFFRVP